MRQCQLYMEFLRRNWYKSLYVRVQSQTLIYAYLGFWGSVLGHSKHVGPCYEISGHMYLIYFPVMALQCRCDTSSDLV